MRTADRCRALVIERALDGPGVATAAERRAAFDNSGVDSRIQALVDTVARAAWTVTDADVAAVRAAGLSDDEIFEQVVCAALGQASRQRASAMTALEAVTAGEPATEGGV